MIDLPEPVVTLLRSLLKQYLSHCQVYVFGSRIQSNHHPYSDIDLLVTGPYPIPPDTLWDLKMACSESDIPYSVDIIDVHTVSDSFRQVLDHGKTELFLEIP